MEKTFPFKISINGVVHDVECQPGRALLDVLREDLRLTGTKRGCDIGVCGSCTVLIGGRPKRACAVKMKEFQGTGIRRAKHEARSTKQERISPITLPASCLLPPASDYCEQRITTIEGLSKGGKLHPIQQAFIDCGAIQCGFCTPGMVLSAKALLDSNPRPTREEIKKALANNLCRCTGYQQIFEAVEEAARQMKAGNISRHFA